MVLVLRFTFIAEGVRDFKRVPQKCRIMKKKAVISRVVKPTFTLHLAGAATEKNIGWTSPIFSSSNLTYLSELTLV